MSNIKNRLNQIMENEEIDPGFEPDMNPDGMNELNRESLNQLIATFQGWFNKKYPTRVVDLDDGDPHTSGFRVYVDLDSLKPEKAEMVYEQIAAFINKKCGGQMKTDNYKTKILLPAKRFMISNCQLTGLPLSFDIVIDWESDDLEVEIGVSNIKQ